MEQILTTAAVVVGALAACCTIYETIAGCVRRFIKYQRRRRYEQNVVSPYSMSSSSRTMGRG